MSIFGKYKFLSSENYDAYLQEIDVGFLMRKVFLSEKPTVEIKQDGSEYIITTKTEMQQIEMKFKLGEEFEDTVGDDRNCKSVIVLENGNKLVQTKQISGLISKIVREFHDDKMTMTLSAREVLSTHIYTKEKEEGE